MKDGGLTQNSGNGGWLVYGGILEILVAKVVLVFQMFAVQNGTQIVGPILGFDPFCMVL